MKVLRDDGPHGDNTATWFKQALREAARLGFKRPTDAQVERLCGLYEGHTAREAAEKVFAPAA